jgi:hypothetical protein
MPTCKIEMKVFDQPRKPHTLVLSTPFIEGQWIDLTSETGDASRRRLAQENLEERG